MSNNVQDAENLSYDDRAFDLVVVHAGLHPCYSPHRALLEMYRVARRCVVASVALRYTAIAIEPLSKLFALLLPRQCNEFAFAISKSNRLQPWMETPDRIRATGC
jgi:ubiquinone/menaquinone biosynthesis C-methylase UbiE